MQVAPRYALYFFCLLVAGCSSLGEHVENRVAVAETCREAMAAPLPGSADPTFQLASIRLGSVGSCEFGVNEGIVALCAYRQIWKKYQPSATENSKKDDKTAKETIDDVEKKWGAVKEKFIALKQKIAGLDSKRIAQLTAVDNPPPNQRARELQTGLMLTAQEINEVAVHIDLLRERLSALRLALAAAKNTLGEQASIELAAWDSNVRVLLDKLEQVLSGNASVVLTETLRNQVVRHVAKRSLDLIHSSLKPADAAINKLDDKAYGLISAGYLTFQGSLQEATDHTYTNLTRVYRNRMAKLDKAVPGIPMEAFLVELRRAACENLVEGTKFSMLTELVDTMLIKKVGMGPDVVVVEQSSPPQVALPTDNQDFLLVEISSMNAGMAYDADASSAETALPKPEPAGVYLSNEWAARQKLLVQAIGAQRAVKGADGAGTFPGIATVDEDDVRRLADAATAKTIDDAARINPALLALSPEKTDTAQSISNYVNVMTAASAVSQASAILIANVSNTNINSFNPNNTNAPIINIPPYPSPTAQQDTRADASLCATNRFSEFGATCMVDGSDYIVVFDRAKGYQADACEGDAVKANLTGVGMIVSQFTGEHNIHFDISVSGYASVKRAALARCEPARQARKVACTHKNYARELIEVQGCLRANGNQNVLLSAARAKHTAKTLEEASRGALLVRKVVAMGAQPADAMHRPYDPEAEQTVVLRFRRMR